MKEELNTKFYFYVRINGVCSIYSFNEFEKYKENIYTSIHKQLPGNLVTVCIIVDDKGNTARGLSVLSLNDSFVLEVGMDDAERKAIRAIKGRKLEKEYSDKRAVRVLIGTRCPYTFPAERVPKLSFFEKRILFGKKYIEKEKNEKIAMILAHSVTKNSIKGLEKAFYRNGVVIDDKGLLHLKY